MTMSACLSAAESMVGKLVVQQQGPTGRHVLNMGAAPFLPAVV